MKLTPLCPRTSARCVTAAQRLSRRPLVLLLPTEPPSPGSARDPTRRSARPRRLLAPSAATPTPGASSPQAHHTTHNAQRTATSADPVSSAQPAQTVPQRREGPLQRDVLARPWRILLPGPPPDGTARSSQHEATAPPRGPERREAAARPPRGRPWMFCRRVRHPEERRQAGVGTSAVVVIERASERTSEESFFFRCRVLRGSSADQLARVRRSLARKLCAPTRCISPTSLRPQRGEERKREDTALVSRAAMLCCGALRLLQTRAPLRLRQHDVLLELGGDLVEEVLALEPFLGEEARLVPAACVVVPR